MIRNITASSTGATAQLRIALKSRKPHLLGGNGTLEETKKTSRKGKQGTRWKKTSRMITRSALDGTDGNGIIFASGMHTTAGLLTVLAKSAFLDYWRSLLPVEGREKHVN